MRSAGRTAALLLLLLVVGGCGDRASAPATIGDLPADRFLIERDRFLAADVPATVPADRASFLRDDDEVLGLVVDGHARAYPVPMLAYHHVVNDVLQGIPIAVTY